MCECPECHCKLKLTAGQLVRVADVEPVESTLDRQRSATSSLVAKYRWPIVFLMTVLLGYVGLNVVDWHQQEPIAQSNNVAEANAGSVNEVNSRNSANAVSDANSAEKPASGTSPADAAKLDRSQSVVSDKPAEPVASVVAPVAVAASSKRSPEKNAVKPEDVPVPAAQPPIEVAAQNPLPAPNPEVAPPRPKDEDALPPVQVAPRIRVPLDDLLNQRVQRFEINAPTALRLVLRDLNELIDQRLDFDEAVTPEHLQIKVATKLKDVAVRDVFHEVLKPSKLKLTVRDEFLLIEVRK